MKSFYNFATILLDSFYEFSTTHRTPEKGAGQQRAEARLAKIRENNSLKATKTTPESRQVRRARERREYKYSKTALSVESTNQRKYETRRLGYSL